MSGSILAVSDTNNHTIRKIAANGDVTTIAGLALTSGFVDGFDNAQAKVTEFQKSVDGTASAGTKIEASLTQRATAGPHDHDRGAVRTSPGTFAKAIAAAGIGSRLV